MEQIRQVAIKCVARAVFFGSLAIGCTMIGFAFDPIAIFRSGAIMALLMAAILTWKAVAAVRQDPKHTEVWLYLDKNTRPSDAQGKKIFAGIMREVYARFAQAVLMAACGLFVISLGLMVIGVEAYEPARLASGSTPLPIR